MSGQPQRKVSVVIPTWRRSDQLHYCLQSLGRQTFVDFETIVVSNGAGEEAAELAQVAGSILVRMATNLGFAAGVNAGIKQGQSKYILVLNDDVELDTRWIERTVTFLEERQDISYCCGKIYQAEGGLLDNAGDALTLGGSAWRLGFGRQDGNDFKLPHPVWAVPATATLFRRSVFERIGNFDESFFAYLEDMDFSLRAAKAGVCGFYLPDAMCRHHGGATLGPGSAAVLRLLTRNQLILLAKHYPASLLLRLAPRIVWAQILWAMLAIRKGRFVAYLAGLGGFLRLLPRAIRQRVRWTKQEKQAFLSRLRNSEREIFADVFAADRPERDTFWRLYFVLFPPRRNPGAASLVVSR